MRLLLQTQLGCGQRSPLAGGTEILPVGAGGVQLVVKSQARQHLLEIFNVPARSKTLAATATADPFIPLPGLLVKLHPQLGRPLEDMKELAEWQIKQSGDDRHGVQNGQELIETAAQPKLSKRSMPDL